MASNGKPWSGKDLKGISRPIYISKNDLIHYTVQRLHERVYEEKLLRKIRYHLTKYDNIGFVRIFPESMQYGNNYAIIPVTYYTTIDHIGQYTKSYTIEGVPSTAFSSYRNTIKVVVKNE